MNVDASPHTQRANTRLRDVLSWFPFAILWILSAEFRSAFERLSWDSRRMEAYELERLQAIVSYAFEHSPFYHDLYVGAGVKPSDIMSLKDIEKLPVVTKKMLRAATKEGRIFTAPRPPLGTLATATAGSSGDPVAIYLDLSSRTHKYISSTRAFWGMGAFPQKTFVLVWRKKGLSIRQHVSSVMGLFKRISVIDVLNTQKTALDTNDMHNVLNELVAFNPQVIRGYTSALWVIAQMVRKYDLPLRPESVITSAEYLPPVWREEMEAIFKCPVHNLYGGTEASPIAASFQNQSELTVFQDFYLSEIVDDTNNAVAHGRSGRVIVTDYHSKYMPLIRYEIGDIAQWSDDTTGPLPKFKEVQGRINDIFVLPGGKIMFSHNWHIYFRKIAAISKCKIVQKTIDTIEISIECIDPNTSWNADLESLKKTVQEAVGEDVVVTWNITDHLALDAGEKFRSVRSEVPPETILSYL